MTRMTAAFPVLVAVNALALAFAPAAQADPIQATYTTTGSIGTTGITGTPDVSFQGVSDGTLTTGQPFSLGQFVVTTPPDGGTTTYETPFQITVTVTSAVEIRCSPVRRRSPWTGSSRRFSSVARKL